MSVLQVFLLACIAVLVNRLRKGRSLALLAVNMLVVYWLQPIQEPANLVFWLPTLMVIVIALVWLLTSAPEVRGWTQNWQSVLILVLVIIFVDLSRHFDIDIFIAVDTPRVIWVIPVLLVIALIVGISARASKISPALLALASLGLVSLLLLVKIPSALPAGLEWVSQFRGKPATVSVISWLGLSYVSFRLLHTLFDRIAGRLPSLGLADFFNYVIFFPSFVAGPIDRAERFVSDLRTPKTLESPDWVDAGTRLFMGLFKKFVIADALAWIALSEPYLLDVRSAGWVWLLLYAYSLQIYFDFSGYTDIAIGLARLLGIRLPENFNTPYLKPNLTLFWNSWHMTLTQWFRSYFFNPLTRGMRAAKNPLPASGMIFLSQVSTMVLIGLWHGATANYVLWGIWHGIGLFIHNRWSSWVRPTSPEALTVPTRSPVSKFIGAFATFNFVSLGWLFFIFSEPTQVWAAILRLAGAA